MNVVKDKYVRIKRINQQDKILYVLCTNKTIDVIYTDFTKAFDKICVHGVIIHNLTT